MTGKITAAAVQMVSGSRISENIAQMRQTVAAAAAAGAQWIVLPEYWFLMGHKDSGKLAAAEDFGAGLLQDTLAQTARRHGIYLSGGTIALKSPEAGKVYNSLLTFSPQGQCIARYDKIHLFHYSGLGERYAESDTIAAGTTPAPFALGCLKVAQGICFDVRFAALFHAQQPADVLILPAAFTAATGRDHWEILLRARAIENQCYVIAAAQGGRHENGRETFGHSMLIDPWGKVLDCIGTGAGFALAQIDPARIAAVRKNLPMGFQAA